MRYRRIHGFLALAACASPSPPPPPVPVAPIAVNDVDAGPIAVAVPEPVPPPPPPCRDEPCFVTKGTVDMVVTDHDLFALKTFGLGGRVQLVRRELEGRDEVELSYDLRLDPKTHIYRMSGDAKGLALATTDGLAFYDVAARNERLIAPDKKQAYASTVDADSVYWMGGDCILKKTPRAGGQTTLLGRTGETYCSLPTIALDDTNVYFAAAETIYSVSKSGGKPTALFPSRKRYLLGLVAGSGDFLYALLSDEESHGEGRRTKDRTNQLLRFPKKGGAPTVLASPPPSSSAYMLAADETRLYWVEYHPNGLKVASVSKEGGDTKVLAEQEGMGYGIAVAGAHVYWVRWLFNGGQRTVPDVFRLLK